jgi:hypothetical protein
MHKVERTWTAKFFNFFTDFSNNNSWTVLGKTVASNNRNITGNTIISLLHIVTIHNLKFLLIFFLCKRYLTLFFMHGPVLCLALAATVSCLLASRAAIICNFTAKNTKCDVLLFKGLANNILHSAHEFKLLIDLLI